MRIPKGDYDQPEISRKTAAGEVVPPKPIRVLVTGGRDYTDRAWVNAALSEIHARRGPITLLIHGGATGADSLAHRWAVKHGVACAVHPADWKTHGRAGRAAGPTSPTTSGNLTPRLMNRRTAGSA